MVLTFGSLFSGIGGLDLGLERAGLRCVWQVEINDYCRRVLAKHWPNVRRHDDVKTFPPQEGAWSCDLIVGGFPCQPVSVAGKGLAQDDPRWLWPEFARILRVLRPRYALLENVPGLFVRGFPDVLGDLATLGYDAEWAVLSAAQFGAPHLRKRVFVVAYSHRERQLQPQGGVSNERGWLDNCGATIFYSHPNSLGMARGQVRKDVTVSMLHKRASRFREKTCARCGTTENLALHHLDGNPKNNRKSNRMTLCNSCHSRWRWEHGKTIPKSERHCSVCGLPARKLQWCQKHYQRFKKYGDPCLTKKKNGSSFQLFRDPG